jgi:hypothetical protein
VRPLRIHLAGIQNPAVRRIESNRLAMSETDVNLQFGQHSMEATLPDLMVRDESPRAGAEDWRLPARHPNAHKRWPSNASRSVRGALGPSSAAWSTPAPPATDLAGADSAVVCSSEPYLQQTTTLDDWLTEDTTTSSTFK